MKCSGTLPRDQEPLTCLDFQDANSSGAQCSDPPDAVQFSAKSAETTIMSIHGGLFPKGDKTPTGREEVVLILIQCCLD